MSSLGLQIVKELGKLRSLMRCNVFDSDAVSAYPSCTAVGNVSRETTVTEIIDILDRDEQLFRAQGINLLQGHVNALEYSNKMFGLPKLDESLSIFSDIQL